MHHDGCNVSVGESRMIATVGQSTAAVVLALLAAVSFAFGTVLQQKGTLQTPAGDESAKFLVQILREPVWLLGALGQVGGWVLQAAALDRGALVVVQSLTTLSLVFALPLGAWLTHQRITAKVVGGAAAVLVGIVLFLSVGSPAGGTNQPSAAAWWAACLVTLALVLLVAGVGLREKGARRALLFGAAAGLGFGLQAAVTKVFVGELGHGVVALLTTWSTYVLIASALSGFVLQQSALKTGVLAPAMASSNAVTLLSSVVLGISVFGETLAHGNGRLAPAVIGLGAAFVGIVVLAGAPPPEAEPPDAAPADAAPADAP
jgi:drug/metabolite transporter (DMT)-like permease